MTLRFPPPAQRHAQPGCSFSLPVSLCISCHKNAQKLRKIWKSSNSISSRMKNARWQSSRILKASMGTYLRTSPPREPKAVYEACFNWDQSMDGKPTKLWHIFCILWVQMHFRAKVRPKHSTLPLLQRERMVKRIGWRGTAQPMG